MDNSYKILRKIFYLVLTFYLNWSRNENVYGIVIIVYEGCKLNVLFRIQSSVIRET